jgi:hypothetical protein
MSSSIDTKLLANLIEQRDHLLEQRPELKAYQKEIEKELEKAGDDPEQRMIKVFMMMMNKLRKELIPAMETLQMATEMAEGVNNGEKVRFAKNQKLM